MVFRSAVYPVQWMTLMIYCGMVMKRMRCGSDFEEDEGTGCEDGGSDTDW
jgi:hypothetical protein